MAKGLVLLRVEESAHVMVEGLGAQSAIDQSKTHMTYRTNVHWHSLRRNLCHSNQAVDDRK